ncbi:alpha/beta hydrolase [Nocardia sp. NPDC051030]|uniref:alpha/beta fold hydrolase n=1 Tax=Nocardia sp. NPDC051030 TaxID=3155162 RepID=UPI00342724B7
MAKVGKIGQWKSDAAQATYMKAYRAAETEWPIPSTDLEIETSFGTTYVRKSGSGGGAPLVLIPGFQGNSLAWYPLIEDLARDRTVYMPDVIGTPGLSVQTAPIEDGATLARWLDEVLTGLGVDKIHLIGFSHGGWLAGILGVHSSRLASLSLMEPGMLVKVRARVLFRMIAVGMSPTPERMRKFVEWCTPDAPFSVLASEMASAALGYRMRLPWPKVLDDAELQKISAPTLVMCGGATVLYDPQRATQRALRTIPNAEVEIYPGVSHGLPYAIPDTVVPRLLEFARQHEPVESQSIT